MAGPGAASIESLSAAGGGLRWPACHPPFPVEAEHEGDPLRGAGSRGLWPDERSARQVRPGWDVEVRIRDRRAAADGDLNAQEGRRQTRRDDDLARSEGDEAQGREANGR